MDSRVLARMFQSLRTESKGLRRQLVLRNRCLVAETAIRGSVKSSGPLPPNPAAAVDLERAITELSRGELPPRR